MSHSYKTPGVYRKEDFLKPDVTLPTGVPGFIGFVSALADDEDADTLSQRSLQPLHRKEEFAEIAKKFEMRSNSYLPEAIDGFFDNGGIRCYIVLADPTGDLDTAIKKALNVLAPLTDLDLVAIPDAMTLQLSENKIDPAAVQRVQKALLEHCAANGNRLAILDSLPESDGTAVLGQRENLTLGESEPISGSLYYPWLKVMNNRFVPPCGHMAGIFARTDAKAGFFKAPANEEVLGALDLVVIDPLVDAEIKFKPITIDNQNQDQLNPAGINCLRSFPGRGVRVWGARTLSHDPNWRYVNVRRLFLTLNRWIEQNMSWATLEPNDPRLWIRIQRELNAYLAGLWRVGALKGQVPEQAFYVKCDAETNPPEARELGQVVTDVGLAPSVPAEFVVVRILHHPVATTIN